ncbi:MAG: xanthine dehydrogenase family protein molybdopterin-binding subunit [Treponema sp.]|nr:xanthine dehydrogenase family protein molybdopterin-binding subunit [Treponema sp.]
MPDKKNEASEKVKKKTAKKPSSKIHAQNVKNFYSDLKLDGMIFAKIIRSPKKSGILKNIEAKNLPEGYFLITAKNFPGKNSIETLGTTCEIFCSEKILYEGQSLAILAGPEKKVLDEIASSIKIEIESASFEKKVLSQKHVVVGGGREKNISKYFSRAAFTVRNKWIYRLNSTPQNETDGALCHFENGSLTIFTPTHWPHHLTQTLGSAFGIDEEKILINKTLSSMPNTNSLWGNTLLVCQICAASIVAGKAVKLTLSQSEHARFFANPGEVAITHRTALTKEGTIKAASIDIDFDAGAYNPFAQEIIDRLTIASTSIYHFDRLEITAQAISSPNPPTSVNLETMDSASFFAIENQMQKICSETGFSPDEIRMSNSTVLKNEKTKMPFVLKIERAGDVFEAVLRQSDMRRKFATCKINSEFGYEKIASYKGHGIFPRGTGFACAYDASGYYGTSIFEYGQKMQTTLQKDGTFMIHAHTPSAPVLEIWKTIAAEILQIELKMVKMNSDFKLKDEPLTPENFYSNLAIMTGLLRKCCQGIQAKRFRTPLPITVSKSITKAQISQWNKIKFRGIPFSSTSFVTLALDLKIDPCTFLPKIKNIWLAVSAGKILAVKEAETKIKFSIQKTLAELMEGERLEAEKISIAFINSETESKQIGALIKKALPAAFSAAISQALNCNENFLPLKSNSLFTLLSQAKPAEKSEKEENKKGGPQ